MSTTIAVEDLRVGMYVQLDGGWLSHPFPLSSFRISGADQIRTLRGLGLGRVRWVPEKSDPATRVSESAIEDLAAQAKAAAADPLPDTKRAELRVAETAEQAAEQAAEQSAEQSEEQSAEQQRAEWVAAQRAKAQQCEAQYGEASVAWREAMGQLTARPLETAATTQALTQAMLQKMLATEDVGIRLVSGGGDRPAAHALNVTVISLLIGRTLGLSEDELADLGVGALLHDVGKIDVADRYRHAEDGFGQMEMGAYREHVIKGVAQGQRMGLSAGALAVLAQHHEHADGSGFPMQTSRAQQELGSRIVAIVDQYDKLCNPCSRALPLTPHQAVAMLFAQGRQRYDATVLNTFIRMMGVYPAGSLVQLTDDRYAMVVGVNSSRPLKPRVLVHNEAKATAANEPQLIDLEQMPDLGIRRSLPASKLPAQALQALDPRPRVSYYFEPIARELRDGCGACDEQPAQALQQRSLAA
jgi:HD-GYP domain-containing protein (c-di-GMP phosphodiesterase class II)